MPSPHPAVIPLQKFLADLARIKTREQEARCVGVLEKVMVLPEYGKSLLKEIDDAFNDFLNPIGWGDVGRWIKSWLLPYHQGIEGLARASEQARELFRSHIFVVGIWNERLRRQVEQLIQQGAGGQKTLCAFSSAVDATYPINSAANLNSLFEHAAEHLTKYASQPRATTADDLRRETYVEYQKDPTKDREWVGTVVELLSEIVFGYEHPRANLKPTLLPGSEAEDWVRRFFIDKKADLKLTGGGASVNIADALGGLGFVSHAFWHYHPELLAGIEPACVGGAKDKLLRCWFDGGWRWEQGAFDEAGNVRDGTGCEHPVRLSMIFSFSTQSPAIDVPGAPQPIAPGDKGRAIFQFKGYRSAGFFADGPAGAENWAIPPMFCRWSYQNDHEAAANAGMKNVRDAGYHRVILSAFQYSDQTILAELGKQCQGMPLHHEISSTFESRSAVEKYCVALSQVYHSGGRKKARQSRTAGINTEELASFTSWQGTDVFAAALPDRKDSFLQSLFRAMKVRDAFHLDWLYVHGNDIDITVANPEQNEQYLEQLRNAMLLAKVVVFAALHVRSGITQVKPEFELSCSPKGFLALYQFARDFARQYGHSEDERKELQTRILRDGYVRGNERMPSVVTVPVYWPDPDENCNMTGAGDVSSGVTAAMAP